MTATRVEFVAPEYQTDGTVRPATYAFAGSIDDGWEVRREGRRHLRLGAGYRLLPASHCGVCATDLARRRLPFPLPQVLGHEVVTEDDDGRAVVVEINASHAARGVAADCAYCAGGLASHCPERRTLGIHDLPGGFGAWLLARVHAVRAVPPSVEARTAALVEPFAAALHAATVAVRDAPRRVAVLGPRRLGSLVVAALAAGRRRTGARFEILALARRPGLRALARALGADDACDPDAVDGQVADVVIDTTGRPDGLARALALATREVHLKSTSGEPAIGLANPTALVVDEIAIAPWAPATPLPLAFAEPAPRTAVAVGAADTPDVRRDLASRGLDVIGCDAVANLPFGAADVAVVPTVADVDGVIRPDPRSERGLVRPRGLVLVTDADAPHITTSRCGDFDAALDLLTDIGPQLADRLITAVLPAAKLDEALAAAASPQHVKVLVAHPDGLLLRQGG
jgi:D-arabinose 1-dehydrogenase-like Zn-dependent alcohol dehydrogenase